MKPGEIKIAIGRNKGRREVFVGMKADVSEKQRLEALLQEARRVGSVYKIERTPDDDDPDSYVVVFTTNSSYTGSLTDDLRRRISQLETTIDQLEQTQSQTIQVESTVDAPTRPAAGVNYLGDWNPSDSALGEQVRGELAKVYGVLEQRGISPEAVQSESTKGELSFARALIGLYLRNKHPGVMTNVAVGQIIKKNQVSVLLAGRKFGDWGKTADYTDIAAFIGEARQHYTGRT